MRTLSSSCRKETAMTAISEKANKNSLLVAFALLILCCLGFALVSCAPSDTKTTTATPVPSSTDNLPSASSSSKEIYQIENASTYVDKDATPWNGEHRCDVVHAKVGFQELRSDVFVMPYNEYKDKIKSLESMLGTELECAGYTNTDLNYIVSIQHLLISPDAGMTVHDCFVEDGKVILYAGIHDARSEAPDEGVCIAVIPTDMPAGTEVEYRNTVTQQEVAEQNSRWV